MENKPNRNRAKVSKSSSEDKKPSQEISFELFFANNVREGKLKKWQHKEIATFFKDLKLREKEDLKVYEDALGKF